MEWRGRERTERGGWEAAAIEAAADLDTFDIGLSMRLIRATRADRAERADRAGTLLRREGLAWVAALVVLFAVSAASYA